MLICIFKLDKTIKLWKVSEKDKKIEGYNTKEDSGIMRDPMNITSLRVCCLNMQVSQSDLPYYA